MEATVYSYKMTFQTLTFRNDPRFQDGLYIQVVTELAENEVNRVLYGPLTAEVVGRFRYDYIRAAEKMMLDAIRLLPRYYRPLAGKLVDNPIDPSVEPLHIQADLEPRLITDPPTLPLESVRIDNPWGIDTTGWTQENKDILAMWESLRNESSDHQPAGYLTAWHEPKTKTACYWKQSPSGNETWYVIRVVNDPGWQWYSESRPGANLVNKSLQFYDTAQAAADACEIWHKNHDVLTDPPT